MKSPIRVSTISRLVIIGLASATFFACAGEDGQDGAAILIDEREADEDECEDGGSVVVTGFDHSGNGELDDGEIEQEYVVCDGADGADGDLGADGDDGEDAKAYVTRTETVEPGEECNFGGQRVMSGIDEDGSGDLSEDEIESEAVMCNETCTGEMALDLDYSELPGTIYDGYEYSVPFDTDASDLAFAAYSTEQAAGGDALAGLADVPPLFEASYDADDGTLEFSVDYADEDGAEFVVLATDGCETDVGIVEFSEVLEGEAAVYVAHLGPGLDGFDVEWADSGDSLASGVEEFEVSGPHTFDWGDDYAFDILDDEGDLLDSTGDLSFSEPWATQTIFVYADDDDPVVGTTQPDTGPLASDQSRLQVFHKADGIDEVDVATVDGDGDTTIHYDDLGYPDASDIIEFAGDPEAYLGLDSDDDGEADITYTSMTGEHQSTNVVDAFVVNDDSVAKAISINYTEATSALHDPRIQSFVSMPNLPVPSGETESDVIDVDDCGTVDGINMDVDISTGWRGDLVLYLENPGGEEHILKDGFGGSTDDIIGNFNQTLTAGGFNAETIDIFEGSDADGEWTFTIEDTWSFGDYNIQLNSWGLNLICSD